VIAELHLAEDAFALHLLLQGTERLIDIVVPNDDLNQFPILQPGGATCSANKTSPPRPGAARHPLGGVCSTPRFVLSTTPDGALPWAAPVTYLSAWQS
jgi:hypothetical protein